MLAYTDNLLTHLGTGKWTVMHIILLSYVSIILSSHVIGGALYAPRVDFSCRISNNFTQGVTSTVSFLRLPNSSSLESKCDYRIETPDGEKIEQCVEFDFDNSTFTSTFTSEYNLVCDQAYLQTLFQSIFMFGVLVGLPINGYLSDKYGRKNILVFCVVLFFVLGIGSAWLPFLSTILLARFILGYLYSVCCFTSFILAVEIVEPKLRPVAGFILYVFWGMCNMLYGCLGYLFRDWRMLQTVATIPGLVLIPALWMIDESPRWLFVNGRTEEAIQILHKVARWHGLTLPPEAETRLIEATIVEPQATVQPKHVIKSFFADFVVLVRTPRLRAIFLCFFIMYLISALIFFGLSLSGSNISDDPHLYIVILGALEMPSNLLPIIIVKKFGRKLPLCVLYIIAGVSTLAVAGTPAVHTTTVLTLAMIGKMSITAGFQLTIFYSSELFPTEVRSRGVLMCALGSRLGSIFVPFITDLLGSICAWAPFVVFGLSALVGAALCLPLSESQGQTLLDTVEQLEQRHFLKSKFAVQDEVKIEI